MVATIITELYVNTVEITSEVQFHNFQRICIKTSEIFALI